MEEGILFSQATTISLVWETAKWSTGNSGVELPRKVTRKATGIADDLVHWQCTIRISIKNFVFRTEDG
eukprot:5380178-Pyramimonas_sp.AAC.1